jgi:hypothetical protein
LTAPSPPVYGVAVFGRFDLMKDGTTADGVVIDVELHFPLASSTPMHPQPDFRLTLQITYDDGTQADVRCEVGHRDYKGSFGIGDVLPARYDPKNRESVTVDIETYKAAEHAKRAEQVEESQEWARKYATDPQAPARSMDELDRKREEGLITDEEWQEQANKIMDELL